MPSKTPPTVWRSPRLRQRIAQEEIEILKPPPLPRSPSPILRTLLPAITSVSMLFLVGTVLMPQRGNVLAYSAPLMLASSLVAVIFYLSDQRGFRRGMAKRETDYKAYLEELNTQLATRCSAQLDVLMDEHPDPPICEEMLDPQRPKRFRQLWAKRPEDDDFLVLRVGTGERPSEMVVKMPAQADPFDPDPLLEEAGKIQRLHDTLPKAPLTFDLRQTGAVGIAGPQKTCLNLVRSLIVHLTTHHAPNEVKLGAIYAGIEADLWSWMRWLPHVWDNAKGRRYLACDAFGASDLLHHYGEIMDQRQRFMEDLPYNEREQAAFSTYHVVLLAAPDLTAAEPVFARLISEGPSVGIYPILVRSSLNALMNACQYGIRVGETSSRGEFGPMAGPRSSFIPDHCSLHRAERFALNMAPLRVISKATVSAIPTYVPLLDVLEADDVAGLNLKERWDASLGITRSLAAPIGRREGNEPLMLDLHERAHGPNGLVAGMVGAGKSELLQSVVASIACNYHPHQVAFVLIDYKGGGMADPFKDMPHTLGTINNLQDESLAKRAVMSLKVELDRRLRLFQKAGVNHINKYQQLYAQGRVKTPIPYLVVIVDEFAELKTEHPDVAQEFVRVARLGRAPGLCLILAMQKPAGIVDGQIEGNTRFRLCLRVAQVEDSKTMLGRPEAAYVTGIGRAYFQVGVNEQFSLFQVAYGGAPYLEQSESDDTEREIREVYLDGAKRVLEFASADQSHDANAGTRNPQTQLQAVVHAIVTTARTHGIPQLPNPWLPPLPEHVTLDGLLSRDDPIWKRSRLETVNLDRESIRARLLHPEGWDGKSWLPISGGLDPVVGLVDDPAQQAQYPQEIDFETYGHVAIFGSDTSDTTSAIQTLFCSLARTWSPQQVQLYAIDYGGQLSPMQALPHVGAIVREGQSERLQRLLRMLWVEIDRRKALFAQSGTSSLRAYREGTGDAIPAIVLAMDNFGGFWSQHSQAEQDNLAHYILRIGREGAALGIHMVATATAKKDLHHSMYNLFGMSIVLSLNSDDDVYTLLGRTGDLSIDADIPMRGIIDTPKMRLIQMALPIEGESEMARSLAMTALFAEMDRAWHGERPAEVPATPESITLSELYQECAVDRHAGVPIGLDLADLSPIYWQPGNSPLSLVLGQQRSGKTNLLITLLLGMCALRQELAPRVYIIDSAPARLARFERMPCVEGYAADAASADAIIETLTRMVESATPGDGPLVLVIDDVLNKETDVTSAVLKKTTLPALLRKRGHARLSVVMASSYENVGMTSTGIANLNTFRSAAGGADGALLGAYRDQVFDDVGTLVRATVPSGRRFAALQEGRGYWSANGRGRAVLFCLADAAFQCEVEQ